jgi:predicted transposase YdaD
MGIIAEMIREDAIKDKAVEIAKNMLRRGTSIEIIMEDTGLDEGTVHKLQSEVQEGY